MNVSLTRELDEFVGAKVASGRYSSASEVVREALRLMEERDEIRNEKLAAFQEEVDRRLASLDRGESVTPAAAKARLRQRSAERRHERS